MVELAQQEEVTLVIECRTCGWTACGGTEDELKAKAQEHEDEEHEPDRTLRWETIH